MRSYRYKYRRHCATDCLHAHDRAGWHVYTCYCMQKVSDHQWRGDMIYKLKNYHWWTTVHRWDWRFTNDVDRADFVISNMEYTKWRIGPKYEMYNMNHEY